MHESRQASCRPYEHVCLCMRSPSHARLARHTGRDDDDVAAVQSCAHLLGPLVPGDLCTSVGSNVAPS